MWVKRVPGTAWEAWGGVMCIHNNTLTAWQNDRHFADDIFKYIYVEENVYSFTQMSMTFVPNGAINNKLGADQGPVSLRLKMS